MTSFTTVEDASPMMPKKPVELTQAEWAIIKAVWDQEPCTAPAIQQTLHAQTGWAYSTVRTLMDRMVGKELLTATKSGKHTLFRSAVTRRQAQHGELLYALKNAFNGALTPMVQCLLETGELSAREVAEVEALLRAKKKGGKQ
ncbi:MAG TPA: BlaI/MecI/CopY family transcriptional regulator [Clostridia bacterium]|nr:BlaI/MecI/CopY family transcriptional regulator [Clostridia bacterium]